MLTLPSEENAAAALRLLSSPSRTAAAWILFMGYSPSETGCSSVSPHGLQLLPETCSCLGSPWATGSFRACTPVITRLQVGYLLQHGPPWAAGEQLAPPWSSPQAAVKYLLWCLQHFLPLLLHQSWCLHVCFSLSSHN